MIFSNKKERNSLKSPTSSQRLKNVGSKINSNMPISSGHTRVTSKDSNYGRNFGLKSSANSKPRYGSSNTNMKSSSIVQSLLTPKNGFSAYDHSSNTSSTQSLKGVMNSTTSTNNTLFTEPRHIQMNTKIFMEPSNYDFEDRNRARDYHETYKNETNTLSKCKTKTDNLLRDSLSQRRNFVNEIEGRLKGLRGDKATPTFKNVSKEDIKAFNFDNELERLKRTLHDIKDQECRFIEILSRKSPDKLQRQSSNNQNQTLDAKRSIELLYRHQDPSVDSMSTSNYRKECKRVAKPNNNISEDLAKFTHMADSEMNSHVVQEKEVQLSEIEKSELLYDRPSN